jgi:hypothetical protein
LSLRSAVVLGPVLFLGLGPWALGLTQQSPPAVPTFAGNPQHTSIYDAPAQDLQRIRWSTSIDLTSNFRTTHYGAPLVTAGNSVVVPVKTATDTFQIDIRDLQTGALRTSPIASDYILPPHNWIPVFSPTLARHVDPVTGASVTRLYYAGAGGSIFVLDDPDTGAAGPPIRRVFYGLGTYEANRTGFNATVFVSTPLTADSRGNVYFGFLVQGTAPASRAPP